MALAATDLPLYWATSRPESDTAAVGGVLPASTLRMRPTFTQIAANDTIQALSDGADVRSVTITGLGATTGTAISETKALTGATPIDFATLGTVERILKVTVSASDATRTVTIRRATGGMLIGTIAPLELGFALAFYGAESSAEQTLRYEKVVFLNAHATETLRNAQVRLSADPSTCLEMAVDLTKDASSALANRLADAPTLLGLTFADTTRQAVPGGTLAPGETIGVWLRLTRAGSAAAIRDTATVELAGYVY